MDSQPLNNKSSQQPKPPSSNPPQTDEPLISTEQGRDEYEPNPFKLILASVSLLLPNLVSYIVALVAPLVAAGLLFTAFGLYIVGDGLTLETILDPQVVLTALVTGLVILVIIIALSAAPLRVLLASAQRQKIGGIEALKQAPAYALRLVATYLRLSLEVFLPLIVALLVMIIAGVADVTVLVFLAGILGTTWTLVNLIRLFPAFVFFPYVLLDENASSKRAAEGGKVLGKGRILDLLAIIAAIGIGSTLLQLVPVPLISGLLAMAYSLLVAAAVALRYVQLKANPEARPATGFNVLTIIAYVIVSVVFAGIAAGDKDSSLENELNNEIEGYFEQMVEDAQ